jgi:hypothetical protein
MAGRQHDKLLTPGAEWRCAYQECPSQLLHEGRERGAEVAFHVGAHNKEVHPQASRRLLHVTQLGFGTQIVRVDEHRDGRSLGNHFVQQAEPLCLQP